MRILVIKLGALGDVVLAFQPFADIRAHCPDARITLLTTAPFVPLLSASPWFDRIVVDSRPAWWDLVGLRRLQRALQGFDLAVDLQTSARSSRYFRLAGRPAWSGIARGASLPHANPGRNAMHTVERQREQLAIAGIPGSAAADLGWLKGSAASRADPYGLIVPGAAPHRPGKRWPLCRFAGLAQTIAARGLRPVIIGSAADTQLATTIVRACPSAQDLTGRTSLIDLGALAGRAALAVGNDTGPMHLAAAVGCPCVVLFSAESDPALTAPRGRVTVLRVRDLADLPVERVAAALPARHRSTLAT